MQNRKLSKLLLSIGCFIFAGIKIGDMLSNKVAMRVSDTVFIFVALAAGFLYLYIYWKSPKKV